MYRPPWRHVNPHMATGVTLGATPSASGDRGPATNALALATPKPSTSAPDAKLALIRAVNIASPHIQLPHQNATRTALFRVIPARLSWPSACHAASDGAEWHLPTLCAAYGLA